MVVMSSAGRTSRVDFHDDPEEEFFYQLRGDMVLKVIEDGLSFGTFLFAKGDVILASAACPSLATAAGVPGSIGLVVEGRAAQRRARRMVSSGTASAAAIGCTEWKWGRTIS